MSLGNTTENDLLLLVFNNTNDANVGDATGLRGSTTAGSLYLALHTADPGEAGDQTTSEATYTGYARTAIARSSGGFTVTNNQVVNAATVSCPQRTDNGAAQNITFWSLGVASSGASKIICRGFCGAIASLLDFTVAASTDTFTMPGHSLASNDQVVFHAAPGATLGTGITDGTIYFVKTPSGNTFLVSASSGPGATLDVTADGAGFGGKVVGLSVTQNVTPQFASGQLTFQID